MGYKRRNGPIDYKGYGRKKTKSIISLFRVAGVLILLFTVCWILVQLFSSGEEVHQQAEHSMEAGPFLQRKNIYDRNLQPLAVTYCQYAAYIKPLEVKDKKDVAQVLSGLLGLDEGNLLARLHTERTFVWLGQQLQSEQAKQLLELDLNGVYLQEKPARFYPHGESMAQLLGYVKDGKGLAGIELYYDGVLTGGVGRAEIRSSSRSVFDTGKHVVLTIDLTIQKGLEKAMTQLLQKTEATSVSAMVIDTASGAILASAQMPSFDPNRFWDGHPRSQQLRMFSSLIDMGGLSALFRYAAAVANDQEGSRIMNSALAGQSESVRVLRPTIMKTGHGARAGYWWPWPGGGYISNELTELPDPTISASALVRFQQQLGIGCADGFDFPDRRPNQAKCEEGQWNGISLLSGFTRLLNGGKPLSIHAMNGTVADDGTFSSYEFTGEGEDLVGVSSMLGQSFAASAGDGARLFAVEYLSPRAEDDAVTVETANHGGDAELAVLAREHRHDALLLGAIPAKDPQVTVLVVVEEGVFDVRGASPLRNVMNPFARQVSLVEAGRVEPRLRQIDPDVLNSELIGMQDVKKPVVRKSNRADILFMPDIRGKSLRKALVVLQPYMVTIDIQGAGLVVQQNPEPGAKLEGQVTLTLGRQE